MRRLLPLLLALCVSCSALGPAQPARPNPSPSPNTPAAAPTATPRPQVSATLPFQATVTLPAHTPTVTPPPASRTPAPTLAPTVTAEPTAEGSYHLTAANVHFHPDPVLYSGDIASVEVVAEAAPPGWASAPVSLYVGERQGEPLATANFGAYGLGSRLQATFTWVWDTTGLDGPQTVTLVVSPQVTATAVTTGAAEQVLSVPVDVRPAGERPANEVGAHWAQAQSTCCIFNYITGSAAERDLAQIQAEADTAFARVETTLGVTRSEKVVFTLLSRLLGHGGFASSEILLTYIDRNPAYSDPESVFVHEGTHLLDRQISSIKPSLLTEGLAVYTAGGHFKTENLTERAAALVALGRYIPLETLANNFYPSQHEIGYLEGGAFIEYLVQRFGWQAFRSLYGSFKEAPTEAQMLDNGLQAQFGLGLAQLEADWLAELRARPRDPAQMDDLRLTVALFDTLRRYQQLDDPSAYFLTAWLPDAPTARQRGLVADYLRHPDAPANITFEAMLVEAGANLRRDDYPGAEQLLAGVNAALDAGRPEADPLAAEHLAVVQSLLAAGYEAQSIRLAGATAQVTAIRDWPRLEHLSLVRGAGGWQIVEMTR